MSRLLSTATTKKELYRDFDRQLKRPENRAAVLRALASTCDACQPPNPIMCVESCPIWTLKRKHHDALEDLADRPALTDLLRLAQTDRRLTILEALCEQPATLAELHAYLTRAGSAPRRSELRRRDLAPLLDAALLTERGGVYALTPHGTRIYRLLTTSGLAKLPLPTHETDEQILQALLASPQPADALRGVVPVSALRRGLRRLQKQGLLETPALTGRVFYHATKKRPTRKLTPTELKVFKAVSTEGLSAKDVSAHVGISLRRVYTYLRRLKYKQHVRKEERPPLYQLTEVGQRVAHALTQASRLITD